MFTLKPKEVTLFQWSRPRKVELRAARTLSKLFLTFAPRFFLVLAILSAATYLTLNYCIPPAFGIDWQRLLWRFFAGAIGIYVLIPILAPWLLIFPPQKYKVTSERIVTANNAHHLKWNDVVGYISQPDPDFPDITTVVLVTRTRPRTIYLPPDEKAPLILSCISSFVPLLTEESLPRPPQFTTATRLHETAILIMMPAYVFLSGHLMAYLHRPSMLVLLGIGVFGPGTVVLALFFGRKVYDERPLRATAILWNVLCIFLTAFAAILLQFWQFRIEFNLP